LPKGRGSWSLLCAAVSGALLLAPATAGAVNTVSFHTVGSMAEKREFPGAALLPDGRALVVGGYDGSKSVATTELFDPKTHSFSPGPTMTTPRYAPAVASLPDGRVLIAGGYDGSQDVAGAVTFNPKTGAFSPVGSLATARDSAFAVRLPNGKILVGGGNASENPISERTLNSTEIFDPKTNTFSPGTALPERMLGAAAASISGGRILIAGGYRNIGLPVYLDKVRVFDPVGDTFATLSPLPTHNYGAAGASLPQGRALVAGGYDDDAISELGTALIFDPATNTLNSNGIGNLRQNRQEAAAVELMDGSVLVAGGYGGDFLNTAELLIAPSNAFKSKLKGRKVTFSVTTEGTAQTTDASTKIATTAKKKKKRPKLVRTTSKHGGPGKITVKIKLTKRGSAMLRQQGKVKVRLAYTPDQGVSATRKLKLRTGK